MATTLKAFVRKKMENARKMYIEDLEATPDEVLAKAPGGSARTPYDFTYEVVYVNRRVAKRMKGEDPGPANMETWLTAPAEFQSKAEATRQMKESTDAILAAWDEIPDTDLEKVIPLPKGETSPLDLASLTMSHLNYHDAQLNYVQAMSGDDKVHWNEDE